ncbi:hypothetical protein Tco_1224862 [Tanacetum coccineum]
MDDPKITMEEYIRLEEEKAQKCGKLFNWEIAKYGKIWYDEDVHDLRSVETEFLAIVFNDKLTSNETPSCEATESSFKNNKINFRISFDESNDEDYTVVFDKNSFSYKIVSTNDLKTDLENENEKVNKSLFPSLEPTVSCIDDLDFFKDFENEFPAIVYNDALTSKSDFSTEPTLSPQHIDEFDLKDKTSLSEYDEMEQNVLYFNDLFPFNIIYPDDLKSDKGNDDNEIDMIQSSGGNENTEGSNNLLIPFDPKWYYKDSNYARMLRRPRYGSSTTRSKAPERDSQGSESSLGKSIRRIRSIPYGVLIVWTLSLWDYIEQRRCRLLGFSGDCPFLHFYQDPMLRLCHKLIACSITGRSQAPEKVTVTDLFYLRGMDVGSVNVSYLLARYLILFASGRKQGAMIFGGQYIARLAEHFGLLTEVRLQGLTVISLALSIIDMAELEGDTRGVTEEALVAPRGGDEDEEMPQAVPPPPRTQGKRISILEEEVHGMREALQGQREVLDSMACDFSRFTTWTVTSLARLMDRAGVPYTRYSELP